MASVAGNADFEEFKGLLDLCIRDDAVSEEGVGQLHHYLEDFCTTYEEKINACHQFLDIVITRIPAGMLQYFAAHYTIVLENLTNDSELMKTNLQDFIHEIRRYHTVTSNCICAFIMNHVLKIRRDNRRARLPKPDTSHGVDNDNVNGPGSIQAQEPQPGPEEGEAHTNLDAPNDKTMSQNFSTISLHEEELTTEPRSNSNHHHGPQCSSSMHRHKIRN